MKPTGLLNEEVLTVRAWVVSDIHVSLLDRLRGSHLKVPRADLCICAGDVSDDIETTISYLQAIVSPQMPIILVLGNHDYFASSIDFALDKARRLVEDTNIHLLENDSVEVGGCQFIGATLWTDFSVEIGGDAHVPPEERRMHAFGRVPYEMLDFQYIFRSDERKPGENGKLTVQELFKRHTESRSFIDQELSKASSARTIVVTHHAPLMESFDTRFYGQVTNACFGSDLSGLITLRRPSVWIHGHIHRARDYMFAGTRIICNPRGFSREHDTGGFRPGFILDL